MWHNLATYIVKHLKINYKYIAILDAKRLTTTYLYST